MNAMLIFFTVISVVLVALVPPVWFASSIEDLNRSNSKLRFIPIVNEIRAEVLYWGFGPITISWILLILMSVLKMVTWWFMYGSVIATICYYGLYVAIAFWFVAKSIAIFRLNKDLALTPMGATIVYSIIYPVGYYMLQTTCRLYKGINGEG